VSVATRPIVGRGLAQGLVVAAIVTLPALQPTGPGNTGPVDVAILLAVAATALWAWADRRPAIAPYAVPVMVIVAGGAIGALNGGAATASMVAIAQDAFLLLWTIAVAMTCSTPGGLRLVLRSWIVAAFLWASFLVMALLTQHLNLAGVAQGNGTRAAITFGDPNLAADYFFVSLMLVLASRYPRRRVLRLGVEAMVLTAIMFTGSNGGFFAVVVGFAVVTAAWAIRRFGVMPVIAGLALMGVTAYFASFLVDIHDLAHRTQISNNLELKYSVARSPESLQDRKVLFDETTSLYLHGSLLGIGPAQTKTALQREQAPYVKEAHDDYLASLVERGIIGFVGLLLLLGELAARSRLLLMRGPPRRFAAEIPCPTALVGAVLGLAVSGLFYETLHFRHLWAVWGIVAALTLRRTEGAR
jgi:O-antigen ligase